MLITDQVATAPCTDPIQVRFLKAPTSAEWLLVRTTRADVGTLRDARVVYLAANYIVGIALLEPLQARLTACR
jgi:hypothetical protein